MLPLVHYGRHNTATMIINVICCDSTRFLRHQCISQHFIFSGSSMTHSVDEEVTILVAFNRSFQSCAAA